MSRFDRERSSDRGERGERGNRGGTDFKRKSRHIQTDQVVDYKDYELLRKFMTERGKIIPGRFLGTSAKQQRQIKRAIRRARVMGLLP